MKDKKLVYIIIAVLILLLVIVIFNSVNKTNEIIGTITEVREKSFTLMSDDNNYDFYYLNDEKLNKNDIIKIKYKGKLNVKKINKMKSYVIDAKNNNIKDTITTIDQMDTTGIFSKFYDMAYTKLETLSLDEKIGQLLLARVPDNNAIDVLKNYKLGGYVLFSRDFTGLTKVQVQDKINSYQKSSDIPMLIATDEEGGSVIRASSNKNLIPSPFLSSQELYKKGGFDLIAQDTIDKSKFLQSLGVNVNLAPVADLSTNPDDYIYDRAFGKDASLTSSYIKTVIRASKKEDVSYVLKHFPGYGNNADSHDDAVTDNRTYNDILSNDIPVFEEGIKAGAEAVLVSHNIITNIDDGVPASMSKKVHELLRDDLGFTGVIISDDMDMGAIVNKSYGNYYTKAIDAGNDIIIVTDYKTAFNQIKSDVNNGNISGDVIDNRALKVLAWKYYKMMFDTK